MNYPVVIYNEAHNDIDRNADWWARHHSYGQAVVWVEAIYQQLAMLAEMPERCPVARENDAFDFEIRQLLVGLGNHPRYRAIFTVRNEVVHVLALLDGAQDQLAEGNLPHPPS